MLDRFLGGYVTASPTLPTQSSAQGVWELEQQASAQVQNAWPLPPNVIQRSLRFNAADSAYLSRTPAAAGNRQTWTHSVWIKRGKLGTAYELFTSGTNVVTGPGGQITLRTSDDLRFVSGDGSTLQADLITTQVFRDPSAWYHLVFAVDTTQATSSNRVKIYVNGTQITAFGTATYPTQNANLTWNQAQLQGLFTNVTATNGSSYFDGYAAEVNFIDGQALTPSSFGETDAQTGVWVPKRYTGTYGTNGFRLPFTNNSTTTALGYDASGNGNNWTPNNFSVTAGTGNDSLLDVPSLYGTDTGLGGEVRGNYCTLNPLNNGSETALSSGNLDVSWSGTSGHSAGSTVAVSSGKWYVEFTRGSTQVLIGIIPSSYALKLNNWPGNSLYGANSYSYYSNDGSKYNNSSSSAYGATFATGDVIGVALDLDAGTLTFYKNGVSQGIAFSSITGSYIFAIGYGSAPSGGTAASVNFGQRPFAYTAPTGFKALCTTNLSASGTVTSSGTFTGNASTDGPFVYLNGVPVAMTINGNAVTFGTQADKLSNGFKVRSSSASYNTSGSNTYSITTNTGPIFRYSNAQGNP